VLELIIDWLVQIIIEYGIFGLFIAMILQSLISPIPSELMMAIGGATMVAIYGKYWGAFIAFITILSGSLIGAVLCYYIAFKGEQVIHDKVPQEQMKIIEEFMNKHAFETIIIARFLPFMPFDAVSYVAGFLRTPLKSFLIATFIGLVPRILFYVLIGAGFTVISEKSLNLALVYALLITLMLLGLFYLTKRWFSKKIEEDKQKEENLDL